MVYPDIVFEITCSITFLDQFNMVVNHICLQHKILTGSKLIHDPTAKLKNLITDVKQLKKQFHHGHYLTKTHYNDLGCQYDFFLCLYSLCMSSLPGFLCASSNLCSYFLLGGNHFHL